MTKKIKLCMVSILAVAVFALSSRTADAALTVNMEALEALDYQNQVVNSLMQHINFYEVGIAYIGPSPITGYSIIKGSKGDTKYTKIFDEINAKNKNAKKQERPELWQDMIKSNEAKAINYLVNALTKTGKDVWEGWPNIIIPGSKDQQRFSIEPQELKFIIPSFSGVIIGSSSRFDESMHEYLIQARAFYPIITLMVPIPAHIEKNRYRENIYANISAAVPGSNIKDGEILITIFPELDSMNSLIGTSREIMAGNAGGE